MRNVKAVVVLGRIALDAYLGIVGERKSKYPFGHGAEYDAGGKALLCCYHPSQQNTQTGRLTLDMLAAVFLRAREIVEQGR